MPARINIVGLTFGKLKVVAEAETHAKPSGQTSRRSLCFCECGKEIIVANGHLISGHTKSCGCWKIEHPSNLSHGHSRGNKTKTYRIWRHINIRCYNRNCKKFPRYGERGIVVCDRWHEFPNFLSDLGECPALLSIERLNNDGNYSCGKCPQCLKNGWPMNCVWATAKTQSRNKSTNRILEFRGITATLAEQCERFGKPYELIRNRLNSGWTPEEAFFSPKRVNQFI